MTLIRLNINIYLTLSIKKENKEEENIQKAIPENIREVFLSIVRHTMFKCARGEKCIL